MIEIDEGGLTFTAVRYIGQILDSFTLPATGVPDGLPELPTVSLDSLEPNPFGSETALSFTLSVPARVELLIYDLKGRRVRSLLAADLPVGTHAAHWDGKSDAGERVASGVYFIRLSGPRDSATRRVVRIH